MSERGFEYPVNPNPPAKPMKWVWGVEHHGQGARMCDAGEISIERRVWSTEEGAKRYVDAVNKKHGACATARVIYFALDFDGP